MTTINIFRNKSVRVGPLDILPLRLEGLSKQAYEVPPAITLLDFRELEDEDGPRVGSIEVSNPTDIPFIIPEGWIVGANLLQVRTFNRATHINAHATIIASVSCVEKGRWNAGVGVVDGGRSPLTVSSAGWNFNSSRGIWEINQEERQSRIWSQITIHESKTGLRPSHSLEQVMREDSLTSNVPRTIQTLSESTFKTMKGQNGVLIGFEGEPLLLEMFSDTAALKKTIKQTLRSISFDVDHLDHIALRESRIKDFIEEANIGRLQHLADEDWAILLSGGSSSINTQASMDVEGRFLHISAINRKHRVLLEV